MGAFKIEIVGVGGHGCERKAKAGEKLHSRCGHFGCPDCEAYDFVQRLRQKGMVREDVAYSVMLDEGTVSAIRAKGLWPTRPEHVEGNPPQYVEIRDPEFLPVGATHIGMREGAGTAVEAWASFPMKAEFTHWPGDDKSRVVDDMLKNERKSGQF